MSGQPDALTSEEAARAKVELEEMIREESGVEDAPFSPDELQAAALTPRETAEAETLLNEMK